MSTTKASWTSLEGRSGNPKITSTYTSCIWKEIRIHSIHTNCSWRHQAWPEWNLEQSNDAVGRTDRTADRQHADFKVHNNVARRRSTRMPSCRWQTRETRNHAKNCSSSNLKQWWWWWFQFYVAVSYHRWLATAAITIVHRSVQLNYTAIYSVSQSSLYFLRGIHN